MAVAGQTRVPALKMRIVDGQLRSDKNLYEVPPSVAYTDIHSDGRGTLADGLGAMRAGATIYIDVGSGQFDRLSALHNGDRSCE